MVISVIAKGNPFCADDVRFAIESELGIIPAVPRSMGPLMRQSVVVHRCRQPDTPTRGAACHDSSARRPGAASSLPSSASKRAVGF
jgi:hypothetical protein